MEPWYSHRPAAPIAKTSAWRNPTMSPIERDEHCGPAPDSAWTADKIARETKGRVEIFNAIKPDGLDNWTMDLDQYTALRDLILEMVDEEGGDDGTVLLKDIVSAAQAATGTMSCSRRAGSPTAFATPRSTSKPGARSNISHAAARNASPDGESSAKQPLSTAVVHHLPSVRLPTNLQPYGCTSDRRASSGPGVSCAGRPDSP